MVIRSVFFFSLTQDIQVAHATCQNSFSSCHCTLGVLEPIQLFECGIFCCRFSPYRDFPPRHCIGRQEHGEINQSKFNWEEKHYKKEVIRHSQTPSESFYSPPLICSAKKNLFRGKYNQLGIKVDAFFSLIQC